jgi:hypothetical protein
LRAPEPICPIGSNTLSTDAITAEGLIKVYRTRKSEVRALDGLGLLGPDSAGSHSMSR